MIYFDNASTTKIDKDVINKMTYCLENIYGNASGKYYSEAIEASMQIKEARRIVSDFLNVNPNEIIFNSGASEGNNHVLKGISLEYKNCHIITTKTEHHSSLKACSELEEIGQEITYLNVNNFGIISYDDLIKNIKSNTKLVSIIWANNEIGSKNDIKKISEICHKNNILLHVDATQIIGKEKINLKNIDVDFLTFSAHKIYGPKGIGVLYAKRNKYGLFPDFKPLISGSQEDDQRGGTYCTHNIVGLAEAIKLLNNELDEKIKLLKKLEEYFISQIENTSIILNGYSKNDKVYGIINIRIPKVNNEIFIKENSDKFAISTGSTCSLNNPSHVLEAIGLNKFEIRNSIRISFGKYNTIQEIDEFIKVLKTYT